MPKIRRQKTRIIFSPNNNHSCLHMQNNKVFTPNKLSVIIYTNQLENNMETKKCSKCQQVLPIDQFGKDKHRKDGLYLYCKPCNSARMKKYMVKVEDSSIQLERSISIEDTLPPALKAHLSRKRCIYCKKNYQQTNVTFCEECQANFSKHFQEARTSGMNAKAATAYAKQILRGQHEL